MPKKTQIRPKREQREANPLEAARRLQPKEIGHVLRLASTPAAEKCAHDSVSLVLPVNREQCTGAPCTEALYTGGGTRRASTGWVFGPNVDPKKLVLEYIAVRTQITIHKRWRAPKQEEAAKAFNDGEVAWDEDRRELVDVPQSSGRSPPEERAKFLQRYGVGHRPRQRRLVHHHRAIRNEELVTKARLELWPVLGGYLSVSADPRADGHQDAPAAPKVVQGLYEPIATLLGLVGPHRALLEADLPVAIAGAEKENERRGVPSTIPSVGTSKTVVMAVRYHVRTPRASAYLRRLAPYFRSLFPGTSVSKVGRRWNVLQLRYELSAALWVTLEAVGSHLALRVVLRPEHRIHSRIALVPQPSAETVEGLILETVEPVFDALVKAEARMHLPDADPQPFRDAVRKALMRKGSGRPRIAVLLRRLADETLVAAVETREAREVSGFSVRQMNRLRDLGLVDLVGGSRSGANQYGFARFADLGLRLLAHGRARRIIDEEVAALSPAQPTAVATWPRHTVRPGTVPAAEARINDAYVTPCGMRVRVVTVEPTRVRIDPIETSIRRKKHGLLTWLPTDTPLIHDAGNRSTLGLVPRHAVEREEFAAVVLRIIEAGRLHVPALDLALRALLDAGAPEHFFVQRVLIVVGDLLLSGHLSGRVDRFYFARGPG